MAPIWLLTGRKQNPLFIKQEMVYYKILRGNMSFGRARKPSLEGLQVKKNVCYTTGLLEQNCCYMSIGSSETRNQKLYLSDPRTVCPHI